MIAELYGTCRTDLLKFLFYRLHCQETAEDLTQESFLILSRAKKTTQIDSPRSFLFKTAANLAVDYIRHHKVISRHLERELLFVEETQAVSIEQELSESEWLAILKKALDSLPSRTRDIFILNRLHGQSYKEIAQSLNISGSAVEKHISRGLLHCRRELGAYFLNSSDKWKSSVINVFSYNRQFCPCIAGVYNDMMTPKHTSATNKPFELAQQRIDQQAANWFAK